MSDQPVDLVIKITERCNFACTFCSSSNISSGARELELKKVIQFLEAFPSTQTIIVNGGDPLMVDPLVYGGILTYIEQHNLGVRLAIVSNLWDFYKDPDKWKDIFDHPKVSVTTSFNYGEGRRISTAVAFTEGHFVDISQLFKERHPTKKLFFIGVIDENNLDTVVDMAKLAKVLGIKCRANRVMESGKSTKALPIGTICKEYAKICESGLIGWERNTGMILSVLKDPNKQVGCPLSRNCDTGIRTLQPSGYYSCPALADDKAYPIDFAEELKSKELKPVLPVTADNFCLKSECLACEAFAICNGCKKHIMELKSGDQVEVNCKDMRKALPTLLKHAHS